jgi:MFS family permease
MMENTDSLGNTRILNAAVIVAALGYFVDIYDLLLFGFVRQKSLLSLGFTKEQAFDIGLSLQNWQMGGMLLGGVLWGVLGDKRGRVSVLYFSIALYSVANVMNGFVSGYADYALFRFIAGIGLAGDGSRFSPGCHAFILRYSGYGRMQCKLWQS